MFFQPNRRGFTLIEILVVVLAVAVLAAVAVPQYQRAIRKSRFSALKSVAKMAKDAQELHYDIYGLYATDDQLSTMDVQPPQNADLNNISTEEYAYVQANHDKLDNNVVAYLNHSKNFANNTYCGALTTSEAAKRLCQAENGVEAGTKGDYTMYLLSGNSEGSFEETEGEDEEGQTPSTGGNEEPTTPTEPEPDPADDTLEGFQYVDTCGDNCKRYTDGESVVYVTAGKKHRYSSSYDQLTVTECPVSGGDENCVTRTYSVPGASSWVGILIETVLSTIFPSISQSCSNNPQACTCTSNCGGGNDTSLCSAYPFLCE